MSEEGKKVKRFVGIDVQVRRGCSFAVLDANGDLIDSGWCNRVSIDNNTDSTNRAIRTLVDVIKDHSRGAIETVATGIDAPRKSLQNQRNWYWQGKTLTWRRRRPSEAGFGRHGEIIIKAHNIANPQWTPILSKAPAWMQFGFRLFQTLESYPQVHEVFPSASYFMLENSRDLNIRLNFAKFAPGPKDMLDACVAAATVREFIQGRGEQVGGGDSLGTIILPRPIATGRIEEVFAWPIRKKT